MHSSKIRTKAFSEFRKKAPNAETIKEYFSALLTETCAVQAFQVYGLIYALAALTGNKVETRFNIEPEGEALVAIKAVEVRKMKNTDSDFEVYVEMEQTKEEL